MQLVKILSKRCIVERIIPIPTDTAFIIILIYPTKSFNIFLLHKGYLFRKVSRSDLHFVIIIFFTVDTQVIAFYHTFI